MQRISALSLCLVALLVTAAASARTPAGNYLLSLEACGYGGGGRFTAIAVDPHNPDNILVGSDVAGVFKSIDGGRSFRLKGKGLNAFTVAAVVYDPYSPGRVYLLTSDGFYSSTDGGESWQRKTRAIRYDDRFFGSCLMLFSRYSLWVATSRQGVVRIPLNTPQFSPKPLPGLKNIKISSIALYRNHFYAATPDGVVCYVKGRWESWNQGFDPGFVNISDLIAHPQGHLYAVERKKGLFRWDAQTQKWLRKSPGLLNTLQIGTEDKNMISRIKAFKAVAANPRNPEHLFLATHPEYWPHRVFVSADGGNKWQIIKDFRLAPDASDFWTLEKTASSPEHIAFAPNRPGQLFLLDFQAVWHSSNDGRSWLQRHHGLQNVCANDIKVDPRDSNTIYLSAWDNGLMVTTDGGRTWKRRMNGVLPGHARELEFSRQNPRKMYLLANPWHKDEMIYIYKSLDGGRNWQDISIPVDKNRLPSKGYVDGWGTNLEIDPRSDETVYAGTNGYGVFKTTNGGRSWRAVNAGLRTPYIDGPNALRIHPRQPDVLFACTLEGGVYKSTDAGRNWKPTQSGNAFTAGMAFDPRNPARILVAAARKTIMLSTDEGRTWQTRTLPGPPAAHVRANVIAFYPPDPKLVLVGTAAHNFEASEGIFFSTDGGDNFRPLPPGDLPQVNVHEIAFGPGTSPAGYIGFNGTTIFRLNVEKQF